jgi:hypothetical protein
MSDAAAMADRDALLARYAAGVDAVRAALAGADDAALDARPADGGWTAREVVHHLADSESKSMSRLRQILVGAEPEIQAYDQDAWASTLPYDLPIEPALAVFTAVRSYSVATLATLTEEDWSKAAHHPEHDRPYSVEAWLQLYADHGHEHAEQIRAARASLGEAAVTS